MSAPFNQASLLHIHRIGDYCALLDMLGVGALLVDPADGRVLHANGTGLAILGRSAAELMWPLPAPEWTLFDAQGDPLPAERNPLEIVRATGQAADEKFARLGPGESGRWVRIRALPVQSHAGGLGGILVGLVDISVDDVSALLAERILGGEIARARRYGGEFCLGLLRLELVGSAPATANDPGTNANAASGEVVRRLRAGLRGADTVAPWGDGTFLILMPRQALKAGRGGLERLRSNAMALPGKNGPVVLTGGVTAFWPTDTRETVLARVGDALEQARQAGGNRICAC